MTRFTPKPVLLLAVLGAILAFGTRAHADFFPTTLGTESIVNFADLSEDSWVLYAAEFPEVSCYLRSALRSAVGYYSAAYSPVSILESDEAAGLAPCASGNGIPPNGIERTWLDPFRISIQAANTGGTTSSPSPTQQTSSPHAGLWIREQQTSAEDGTWLATGKEILPGTPPSAQLFRPPRASA
jgi:hypothetical protein